MEKSRLHPGVEHTYSQIRGSKTFRIVVRKLFVMTNLRVLLFRLTLVRQFSQMVSDVIILATAPGPAIPLGFVFTL